MEPRGKRKGQRVTLPLPIEFEIGDIPASRRNTGLVVNFSMTGMRLACAEPMDEKTKLRLFIQIPSVPTLQVFSGEVVRVIKSATGLEYGVNFVDVPPHQQCELDELVSFLVRKPTPPSP